MFKFLFRSKAEPEVVVESDRDRFARLMAEINEMIDGLAHKPKVTIVPETGHILLETPEQFVDEALALPAPGEGAKLDPTPDPAPDPAPEPEVDTKAEAPAVEAETKAS